VSCQQCAARIRTGELCRACRRTEPDRWATIVPRTRNLLRDRYRITTPYALRLVELAESLGYEIVPISSRGRYRTAGAHHAHIPEGVYVDHPVKLRRVVLDTGLAYQSYAVLSQPYPRAASGAGVALGAAPYGYSTVAELFTCACQICTRTGFV
jgi:hypothetical protein